MEQKVLIIGVAVVLVLVALWMFSLPAAPILEGTENATTTEEVSVPKAPSAPKPAESTPAPASASPSLGTIGGIFAGGGSRTCTYEKTDASGTSINTIYLADGKMRGEFRTRGADASTANLMVYDGTYVYVWKEGMAVGTKTRLTDASELAGLLPASSSGGVVFGTGSENVGWTCHTWAKDPSLLAAPSYVNFTSR